MTTISKALVVLITAVSLAFCGFAIATTAGGPNWETYIRDLPNYKIVLAGDSLTPTWQATTVRDEPVQGGQHKVLAKVLIACLEDQNRKDAERLAKLNERAPLLEAKLNQIRASLSPDETALHEHARYLRDQIAATSAQVDAAAKQVIQKTDEVQQIENRTRDRYQDVLRLETQVNEVRADQFRLSQIRQQLIDQISQVDALLDRARERNEQLYNPRPVN